MGRTILMPATGGLGEASSPTTGPRERKIERDRQQDEQRNA
ncbi:hypothetical protein ACWGQ5_05700 [Streptomyces sp. NPDC055722]